MEGKQSTAAVSAKSQSISILIADDHPVVCLGLANLLATQPDFVVVGEARSCVETCAAVERLQPDLVLLDLELGDATGTSALRRVRKCNPDMRIIVFTAYTDDVHVVDAVKVGVQGYVVKGVSNERLCEAIRIVNAGGMYLDPSVASQVTERLSHHNDSHKQRLTTREYAILKFVAVGQRNKDIADKLFISESTVKFHISSLMAKLGAANRTEAVNIAVTKKLLSL
ncbi:MAG: response regulator transcription factor [Gammaproteobacteria bacterium]|nr:response regulator transcription factor [Gammaproteobacteria bacterium]MDH3378056.1 response regulator transcription factor [Gammaproteobacteria bacterium]